MRSEPDMTLLQKISIGTDHDAQTMRGNFRFVLWLGIVSALLIATNAMIFSYVAANMAERRIIDRDAELSSQYVNSIVRMVGAASYFHGDVYNPKAPAMEAFFRQVSGMPEVLGANVFSFDGTMLWSSSATQIGERFTDNPSLQKALNGTPHPEIESFEKASVEEGSEHPDFPAHLTEFLEIYVPIWSEDRANVVGVVEIYKAPTSLHLQISSVKLAIWLGSLTGAAVLFLTIMTVLRIAGGILAKQERRVVDSEKYAVIGELTSAVAHGLRNPLAAIRSSAELLLDDDIPDTARESANDIVSQSERLESWIRSFLTQARDKSGQQIYTQVDSVIRECLEGFAAQAQTRKVVLNFDPEGLSPSVAIGKAEFAQVINSLLSNSLEAIDSGGEITVRRNSAENGRINIFVEDNGAGIPPEMQSKLFSPFASQKKYGLGVGLALTRRILERCGGTIQLANRKRRGARVTLNLPQLGV
jgi:two-component system, NtrC family, sensor histidine kinase HydH